MELIIVAHPDWCGSPCYLCSEKCVLDNMIKCSPDCPELDDNTGLPLYNEVCKKCSIYLTELDVSNVGDLKDSDDITHNDVYTPKEFDEEIREDEEKSLNPSDISLLESKESIPEVISDDPNKIMLDAVYKIQEALNEQHDGETLKDIAFYATSFVLSFLEDKRKNNALNLSYIKKYDIRSDSDNELSME